MFIFLPPKCWYKLTELTSTESMKTQFTFSQKRSEGGGTNLVSDLVQIGYCLLK